MRLLNDELISALEHDVDAAYLADCAEDNISPADYTYRIFEGFNFHNQMSIFCVIGDNNDYCGEWHGLWSDADQEMADLAEKAKRLQNS